MSELNFEWRGRTLQGPVLEVSHPLTLAGGDLNMKWTAPTHLRGRRIRVLIFADESRPVKIRQDAYRKKIPPPAAPAGAKRGKGWA